MTELVFSKKESSPQRKEQYIKAQNKRRQPEKDRKLLNQMEEFITRLNDGKISLENKDSMFRLLILILESKWFTDDLLQDMQTSNFLLEKIFDQLPVQDHNELVDEICHEKLTLSRESDRLLPFLKKFNEGRLYDHISAIMSKKNKHKIDLNYEEWKNLRSRLGIYSLESLKLRKISDLKIIEAWHEVTLPRIQKQQQLTRKTRICRMGQTRNIVLLMAGKAKTTTKISDKTKKQKLKLLYKEGIVTDERIEFAELTDLGKEVANRL